MKHFTRLLLVIGTFFGTLSVSAQGDDYIVFGTVKDLNTLKKIDGVEIVVTKDGQYFDKAMVDKSGKFEFKLPLGYSYLVSFAKQGFVGKKIELNTQEIPSEDRKGGFETNIDMTLFAEREGFDTSILDTPIGVMHFNSDKNTLEYDFAHTEGIQKQIQIEFKRLDDLAKNMEKMKKEFDALIIKGDQKVVEQKYEEAMASFEKALAIFPKDEPAKAKLANAKALYEAANSNKNKEAEYQKLISDGENRMGSKNWSGAKEKFEAALNLKPSEKLPQDRLKEIEAALAAQGKRAEFDKLVAEADQLFEQKSWEECIGKYEAANGLFPTEKRPPEQLAKARKALDDFNADAGAKAAREKKFNEMMALGEKNFKDKEYETARKNFEEAQRIWPDPKEPQDRIDEIDQLLADMAAENNKNKAANDADAERLRIDKEYQTLIDKANAEFEGDKLAEARVNYETAGKLKEQEKYPKSRITRIDEILAERGLLDEAVLKEKARKDKEAADLLASENAKSEKDRLAEELRQKKLADEEAERQRLENERLKKEEELLAAKNRKRDLNGADRTMEEEAERYYREARADEEKAADKDIKKIKDENDEFLAEKAGLARDIRNRNAVTANNEKDEMGLVYRDGNLITAQNDDKSAKKKDQSEKNQKHWRLREDQAVKKETEKSEKLKESADAVMLRDVNRLSSISETQAVKAKAVENQTSWRSREGALTADEVYEAEKSKKGLEKMAASGDDLRDENVRATSEMKDRMVSFQQDARAAESENINNEVDRSRRQKQLPEKLAEDKADIRNKNIRDAESAKEDAIAFDASKQEEFESKRRIASDKVKNQNAGTAPKSEDSYKLPDGGEKLNQGVNETSYQMPGERMVIERTIRIGNKVDVYKKVISKRGIYYFRNDRSITEVTWERETIAMFE